MPDDEADFCDCILCVLWLTGCRAQCQCNDE